MSSRYVLLCLAGIIAAFAGGFLLANALNRSEIDTLRSQVAARPTEENGGERQSGSELSDDEIQSKTREADSDPTNFKSQKNLGIALSRYASLKQDEKLLVEATRIIDRAADL